MKKNLSILTMILFPLYCVSQVNSIGLSAGYATDGFGLFAQYNQFFGQESKSQVQVGFSYAQASNKINAIAIPYYDAAVHIGYCHVVLSDRRRKRFLGSVGGGGLLGLELLNNGKPELASGGFIDGESKTIYGGYIGTDFSYFVTDNLALSLVINQSYIENSDVGNFLFYVGIGTKFYIL